MVWPIPTITKPIPRINQEEGPNPRRPRRRVIAINPQGDEFGHDERNQDRNESQANSQGQRVAKPESSWGHSETLDYLQRTSVAKRTVVTVRASLVFRQIQLGRNGRRLSQ